MKGSRLWRPEGSHADRIVSNPSCQPPRAERSTLSEHDWQAGVLAELGIPRSGLVTPDSSGAFAPTGGHTALSSEELREPAPAPTPATRADEERTGGRPAPTEWDEAARDAAPAASLPDGPADAEPPSAQVRSAPVRPETGPAAPAEDPPAEDPRAQPASWPRPSEQAPAEEQAAWSPPAWESPPAARQAPPGRDERQVHGWPEEARHQEEAVPNQAAAWELASQTSWGLVAQTPWGTEPAPEEAASPQRPLDRSGAEAWQRAPHPAPPVPPGQPAPQDLVRRSVYGDPLVRRVSRGVRRAVGASAADEVRRTADVEQILSRAVPSCRQIAVTSIRGGAGKTTVAGLTATVIAQYRRDRVLAVDADSGLGSLPLRLGVGAERSLHDLIATAPRTFDEAAPFLARTADGLWVLSGTAGGQITRELDLATFKTAAGGMSRYFSAMVVDCGAGLLAELQRGILGDAHAQVMVTPGTVDGALSARGALEWQARNGYQHLLTRTVIAFVTHTPHMDADLTRAAQLLSGGGMPVVHMPYDRHLATGTTVESARIGQETRAAAIRVALEAFARATSV
jgi:MinD-like ATPase involved in chromosome partitioning or flagellar assembly